MPLARILPVPKDDRGYFVTTTKNTGTSQRETLEEIIVNLCDALGATTVYRRLNSRGSYFYEVQGMDSESYQSASNTLLELFRRIARTKADV